VKQRFVGVSKSFRPAEDVIDSFLMHVDGETGWFGWLHFMEPHYPYDPESGDVPRSRAQMLSRTVISGKGTPEQEEIVRELYRREIRELDEKLNRLWELIPSETRIVFCADHGELLGENGLWGHPGEVRPELLHVPFGTANVPQTGDLVSLVDVPTLLAEEQWGAGDLDRNTAYASYGGKKAAIDMNHIAAEDGTVTHDGDPSSAPTLERKLNRFDSGGVVKEDALEADLEELGYL
jgi:arylsulfatase A-like enzyme